MHVSEVNNGSNDTSLSLGTVDAGTDPWYSDLNIGNHKFRFKIDTGANLTVILVQTN